MLGHWSGPERQNRNLANPQAESQALTQGAWTTAFFCWHYSSSCQRASRRPYRDTDIYYTPNRLHSVAAIGTPTQLAARLLPALPAGHPRNAASRPQMPLWESIQTAALGCASSAWCPPCSRCFFDFRYATHSPSCASSHSNMSCICSCGKGSGRPVLGAGT